MLNTVNVVKIQETILITVKSRQLPYNIVFTMLITVDPANFRRTS